MIIRNMKLERFVGFLFVFLVSFYLTGCFVGKGDGNQLHQEDIPKKAVVPLDPEKIKVELFLAKKWKKEDKEIKAIFREASINRVMIQYFRTGQPPTNLVIGRDVPAPIARLAIEAAILLNGGVHTILPEFRFFPHYVAIGSSAFDEQAEIPIFPEDLDRLRDPSLSTEEFHDLFRYFTGENEELPTY